MHYLIVAYYKDYWDKALDRADTHIIGVVYDAPDGLAPEEVFKLALDRGYIHPAEFEDNTAIDSEAVWVVPCPEYFNRLDYGTIPVKQILSEYSCTR